jgi:hypothetical protein
MARFGEKMVLTGGVHLSVKRERGHWVGFLPGLARPVWAPGAAQVGWLLPSIFFVLFSFSFVFFFSDLGFELAKLV